MAKSAECGTCTCDQMPESVRLKQAFERRCIVIKNAARIICVEK